VRVGPFGDGDDREPVGQLAGNVLGRMNRQIDPVREQRLLDLLDEARLVPRNLSRPALPLVAGGSDLNYLDLRAEPLELSGDEAGLSEGEGAAARADADESHAGEFGGRQRRR
jgi:hypothetical protein